MSSGRLLFSTFTELKEYLRKTDFFQPAEDQEVPRRHSMDRKAHKQFRIPWPDGSPITGIQVRDHVFDRYRERNMSLDQAITDDAIKDKMTTGIINNGCFVRSLPGDDIWLTAFDGEYVAAAKDGDGSMIVVSYYGTRTQVLWYQRQEVQIRMTRKVRAAV